MTVSFNYPRHINYLTFAFSDVIIILSNSNLAYFAFTYIKLVSVYAKMNNYAYII